MFSRLQPPVTGLGQLDRLAQRAPGVRRAVEGHETVIAVVPDSSPWRSPGHGLPSGNGCSLAPMADGGPWGEHESSAHSDLEEHPMTPHPFLDLAAQFARIFVLGMSAAAIVAVPVLLILALLL